MQPVTVLKRRFTYIRQHVAFSNEQQEAVDPEPAASVGGTDDDLHSNKLPMLLLVLM